MDIDEALQRLRPIEEKTVRLHYGIGCRRAHAVEEIAAAFGMTEERVQRILEEAEKSLERDGISPRQLQAGTSQPSRRHRCKPSRR